MREILLFAGTTEGRRLSECLACAGVRHTVCVATEYGEIVLKAHPMATVHKGRMDRQDIKRFMEDHHFAAVVDATHPYACEVTENIREAASETDIAYYRLKREEGTEPSLGQPVWFENHESCAAALEQTQGNILLTTGSSSLSDYCVSEELKKRLYVRVLPGRESIALCEEQGICGKQILAMQGPFSEELNLAILHQYRISCLVTKESGREGGYGAKLAAAKKAGISVFVIGRPKEEGESFEEICERLSKLLGQRIFRERQLEIILAGTGMGSRDNLTREVSDAIREADILLGAERMIKDYSPRYEKKPYYMASQIIPYLQELQKESVSQSLRKAVVLFSGDSGFYSGSGKLFTQLKEAVDAGTLNAAIRILPGISSVAYLAACVGESYQDSAIKSIHGKSGEWQAEILDAVRHHEKTFLLLSGAEDVRKVGGLLSERGLSRCRVTVGYRLSYPEQQIRCLSPEECLHVDEEGLYTCLIRNPGFQRRFLAHGVPDQEFVRDKVPMTKEEVREVSICKMRLREEAVVFDIGSGTGSIAVELARISHKVQVYAIERKKEAVSLIRQNREKFGTLNLTVVEAEAPEGLEGLPVPTHAFLGGSKGRLQEILKYLYGRNPKMRIVINAVTIETILEIHRAMSEFRIQEEEILQLQTSRAKKAGGYSMMQAENPVWICSFTFVPDGEEGSGK